LPIERGSIGADVRSAGTARERDDDVDGVAMRDPSGARDPEDVCDAGS
jgi:hypothetical protein